MPVRVPKQERSRRTRAALTEAAIACIGELGYANTSTSLIAERAGVSVGTFYGYFDDKQAVIFEVLDESVATVADLIVDRLSPRECEGKVPAEVVESLIDAVFETSMFAPDLQQVLWSLYFQDEATRKVMLTMVERVRGALERFAREVAADELRPGIDLGDASFVVFHAVQWNASQAVLLLDGGETPGDRERVKAATTDMVCRYLFPD